MNIAGIAAIGTPAGIAGATPTTQAGFGALLVIGGDAPPAVPAQNSAPLPTAAPAPLSGVMADAIVLPALMQADTLPPMDDDMFEPLAEDGFLSATPEEHPALIEGKPPVPVAGQPNAISQPPVVKPEEGLPAPEPIAMPEQAKNAEVVVAIMAADETPDDAPDVDPVIKDAPTPVARAATDSAVAITPPAQIAAPTPQDHDVAPAPQDASVIAKGRRSVASPETVKTSAKAVPEIQANVARPEGPDAATPTPGAVSVAVAARSHSFSEIYGSHRATRTDAEPVVVAQPGRIGREMGVEIARHVAAGRDEVMVRLDPPEMGRVDIRLSFDRDGAVRGVIAADSPGALDMLRRETGDLNRALSDAGIRSDAQSFRFDSRGRESGQSGHQGQHAGGGRDQASQPGDPALEQPAYRALRASGRIDLMA